MSLTLGTGPLAGRPGGAFNFELDGAPRHRIFFEAFPRRLRAVVEGRVVLDSTRGRLLHETGIRAVPYVPLADVDAELLERTATRTHCPFKGDASYWSLRVGERVVEDAVWAYEAPLAQASWLKGYAALYWGKADAWYVEDARVLGHLRDPYHRVDVAETSRTARVRAGGRVIAETARPKLLFETSLPPRVYVPRADVDPTVLVPADTRTVCPYKGEASYWSVRAGDALLEDAAWSYVTPLCEAAAVADHLSFLGDGIEVELDEPAERFRL
jgi:uncharacterized protein (DUF427 family)